MTVIHKINKYISQNITHLTSVAVVAVVDVVDVVYVVYVVAGVVVLGSGAYTEKILCQDTVALNSQPQVKNKTITIAQAMMVLKIHIWKITMSNEDYYPEKYNNS